MTYQELSSTSEFQKLHPVKQQIIREIFQNGNSSSPEALLSTLMSLNKELSRRNLNFTKEESSLLINAIKETMPIKDRQKVEMLLNLFYR